MGNAVIVDSVRTGLAKSFRGGFNNTRADNMTAHIINALLDRTGIDPEIVEDVILGCGAPEGAQGHNVARTSAVLSKLPVTTGGTTVNRYCSSGLQTVAMATAQIQAGFYDTVIAGGVESISTTHGNGNTHMLVNEKLAEEVPGIYHPMGVTAEAVAQRYGITRDMQDDYAYESQMRTAKAQEDGKYDDEIIPMETVMKVPVEKDSKEYKDIETVVDRDGCNRPETTREGLASLQPVFDPENGSVTAGNSSQLSDGASVTLVMSEEKAKELNLKPLAILRGFTTMGCEPDEMGIGPVFSVPKLLKRNGLSVDDIDLWELNEAFASQVVYCRDKLGISMDQLNIHGGSISIGHPFAMTGSRQVGHLARVLRDEGKRYGIVTMCVGGGMGATGLLEAC